MGMGDCEKCWETPCRCGHDYKDMPMNRRLDIAAAALGVDRHSLLLNIGHAKKLLQVQELQSKMGIIQWRTVEEHGFPPLPPMGEVLGLYLAKVKCKGMLGEQSWKIEGSLFSERDLQSCKPGHILAYYGPIPLPNDLFP